VHCASSTLYLLVDWETGRGGDALARLDYVLFGGEALKADRLAEWAAREGNTCTLLHQYGVAECTDVATSYDLAGYRPGVHAIPPVGRPAYNTGIHLLDGELRPVGPGEQGEIYISGASVGDGYLNNGPENAKFTVLDVDGEPVRAYRTGDRGRVDESGDLVVLGRIDHQVKVRGMRIDPTDIERALARLDAVREAAVAVVHDSGEAELLAFIVPEGDEPTADALRAGLMENLPRNMVPARFVNIPRIPLSPHGKVDRPALVEAFRKQPAESGAAV
jgi:D-alanine--poly(phosphoribitol) ligase subunit 1